MRGRVRTISVKSGTPKRGVTFSTSRSTVRSGRAGLGAWLGMVVATAAKLALVFLMIGIFTVSAFSTSPG